ncbi:coiled-coil domain-containing protein 113-like [Engraulis encrasicolus]
MADDDEQEEKRQVIEQIENFRRANAVLQAETDMFERYLNRIEPQFSALDAAVDTNRGRKTNRSRTMTQDKIQRLTLEQKCDVAQREMDEMREDLQKLKNTSERVMLNLKATLEEADVQLVEVKKSSNEFDRDVAKVLREKKGAMMGAEKILRYFEDRMRAKDTLVEKLRLKNSALHVQKRKLILQMRQKEEMGEALHEVDFQQLKIENSQYLERIDERNQDLLRLKLMAGNTLQVLNLYK